MTESNLFGAGLILGGYMGYMFAHSFWRPKTDITPVLTLTEQKEMEKKLRVLTRMHSAPRLDFW